MALPNSNISVAMVKSELGAATNDVGRLCRHPNVNKWSKWKPVRYGSVVPITETQLASVNFGLTAPSGKGNWEDVVGLTWGYSKPTGGASSPYRLEDFRNYHKGAVAPCTVPYTIRAVVNDFTVQLGLNIAGGSHLIGLSDLTGNLGNLYYCVIVEDRFGGYMIKSSKQKLEEGGSTINAKDGTVFILPKDNSTAYHVLCTSKFDEWTNVENIPSNATFYSLPTDGGSTSNIYLEGASGAEVIINIEGVDMYNSGIADNINQYVGIDKPPFVSSNGSVFFKLRLKSNKTSGNTVFSGLNLFMGTTQTYWGEQTRQSALMYNLSGTQISSITIGANATEHVVIGVNSLLFYKNNAITIPTEIMTINSAFVNILRYQSGSYRNIVGTNLGFTNV